MKPINNFIIEKLKISKISKKIITWDDFINILNKQSYAQCWSDELRGPNADFVKYPDIKTMEGYKLIYIQSPEPYYKHKWAEISIKKYPYDSHTKFKIESLDLLLEFIEYDVLEEIYEYCLEHAEH
jgi:hypothetical protein